MPRNLTAGTAMALAASLLAFPPQLQAAGLMTPRDGGTPALQLQDHAVNVVVEDGYAVTTIEQTFRNPHARDLEAVYSFPVPEKAAVSEFTYWIDGKPVSGEVLPKDQARQAYEEEKAAGREAGVTEQDGHKTFDMAVWPVRSGQDVRVRLSYIQSTHVDTGIGRYVYPLEDGGVDDQKLAFWQATEVVSGRFSFDLMLRPAYPLTAVRVASHPQAQITQAPDGSWHVHLDNGAPAAEANVDGGVTPVALTAPDPASTFQLDTDVVLYWRQAEGLPGGVDLIAHKEADAARGTFMLVVTPGDDLKPIAEGRDWVFVLDTSGSMQSKLATLVEGVSRGIEKLRPEDRFRIVTFDSQAVDRTGGYLTATPENRGRAIQLLQGLRANNNTNLFDGVRTAVSGLEADRTSAILLVTDGVANAGETSQRAFLELVRRADVRLFTFIMGNGANRPLLGTLTRESGGTAFNVSNDDDIVGVTLSAISKVTHEALHGAELEIKGVRTSDVAPRTIGSIYRGQQIVVFGHYYGDGEATVTLKGRVSGQPKLYTTRFVFPTAATANPEIERLWAFSTIEGLMEEIQDFGEKGELKQAVVDLAVQYGLVTPYTSMIVMREESFAQRGIERRNTARLAEEAQARSERHAKPVRSARVDTAQPMFQSPRPSYSGSGSGGGAMGLTGLLLALAAATGVLFVRRGTGKRAC